MRRFLIKNDKYKGHAEVVYNQEGILCLIDLRNCIIHPDVIVPLKRSIPATIALLKQGGNFSSDTMVAEADFDISLEDFKREYPYSRNFHLLDPIWEKLAATDKVIIYYAAIDYRKYCDRNKKWYNPRIAATWLHNKEYLNDWKRM